MNSQRWEDLKSEVLEKINVEEFLRTNLDSVESGGPDEFKTLCLFHNETRPSLHISNTRKIFYCQGCGEKGNLIDLYMKVRDLDFKHALLEMAENLGIDTDNPAPARAPRREKPKPPDNPPISLEKVKHWHRMLRETPDRALWLVKHRGMKRATLQKHLIGWDGQRYTIPVFDDTEVVNVRRYCPEKHAKMIHYTENIGGVSLRYGRPARLYGLDELRQATNGARVYVAEGEWDRLMLAQQGWLAVTGTHGCKVWLDEWNPEFKGKDVILLYDTDRQGKLASARVAKALQPVAASVRVVELPLAGDGQKDVTDWFVAAGRTGEDLVGIIEATPPFYQPEATDGGDEDDLDFRVVKITTFDSVPKKYVLDIIPNARNPGAMEINGDTLGNPAKFRRAFSAYFNRFPEGMPGNTRAWDKIVNAWLDRSLVIEQPPEASELSALREVLADELRKIPISEGRSELDRAKALVTPAGEHIFKAVALRRILIADFGDVTKHTMCAALRRIGCKSKVVKVEGHSVKVWTIPKELQEAAIDEMAVRSEK